MVKKSTPKVPKQRTPKDTPAVQAAVAAGLPFDNSKFLERYEGQQRQFAIQRLYRQLEILEKRIDDEYQTYVSYQVKKGIPLDERWSNQDTLALDLETYYTVAEDLLKAIQILLPEAEQAKLKADKTYKTICILRNKATRHAYDKLDSDPYTGFAWNSQTGFSLKGGTPLGDEIDPGHLVNRQNLHQLVDALLTEFSARRPKSIIAHWYMWLL